MSGKPVLRFEVLEWLLPRKQALMYLAMDLDGAAPADFSAKEIKLLLSVLEETPSANKFWSIGHLCHQLASWGASVSRLFHSCPLSTHGYELGRSGPSCKDCLWKNRMATKLSQGAWLTEFSQMLLNTSVGQAGKFLKRLESKDADFILDQYTQCKTAMAQRFLQVFSFWRELPWRLCAVAVHLFYMGDDDEIAKDYVRVSKRFASECLDQWNRLQESGGRSGYAMFHMSKFFLDPLYPNGVQHYLYYWAHSTDEVMPKPLSEALMQYASALTSMQMLEAEHHYLSQRVSFGRAALPASTCAYLRRRANPDVFQPKFREEIGTYIGCLSELVASRYNNRTESCEIRLVACFFLCFQPSSLPAIQWDSHFDLN